MASDNITGPDDKLDGDATGEWNDLDMHRRMVERLLEETLQDRTLADEGPWTTIEDLCAVHAGEEWFDKIRTALPAIRNLTRAYWRNELAEGGRQMEELYRTLDALSAEALSLFLVNAMKGSWRGFIEEIMMIHKRRSIAPDAGGTAH